MPKTKETSSTFLSRITKEYPGVFRSDNSILFCLYCDTVVAAKQIFQVKQHLATSKHLASVNRKAKGGKSQELLTTLQTAEQNRNSSAFAMDLTKCFLEANIPLHKINHPAVVSFIENHTKYAAPSVTSMRTKYLSILYDEYIEKMKQIAAENYIWVSIDESTDCRQRFVASFVFGVLGVEHEKGRCYLFSSVVLQATNKTTIALFFEDSIKELGVERDKVLLFVSDAAPYMIAAVKALNVLYPKMIHTTCAAHALHRVADFVKDQFEDVNALISYMKSIFIKSPRRKLHFKTLHPTLALPPEPIITRWGSWIESAAYYAEHFDEVARFLNELDSENAKCILYAQKIIKNANLKKDLAFIKANFDCIPVAIKKLEGKGLPIFDAIHTFHSIRKELSSIKKRPEFLSKFDYVYNKNCGLKMLEDISQILGGGSPTMEISQYTPNEIAAFKYAPITSCDVERSFSSYKRVLEDCRHSFLFDNLKKHVIIHCNKFD